MTAKKLYIFPIAFFLIYACAEVASTPYEKSPTKLLAKEIADAAVIIDIQPLGDISEKYTQYIYAELLKVYPNVKLKKAIPLPKTAYYSKRGRYRADSLINDLRQQTAGGHVTIGMTSKDISDTKDNFPDWGVMGLGYQPGKSCVVSTFRLNKKDVLAQLFKLSIHELGHTQGLPHCPDKFCFMRDAEGKNPIGEEKYFCEKCKKHLEGKGWVFKN